MTNKPLSEMTPKEKVEAGIQKAQKSKPMTIEELREKIAEQFYGGYCELEDRTELDWKEALSNADQTLKLFKQYYEQPLPDWTEELSGEWQTVQTMKLKSLQERLDRPELREKIIGILGSEIVTSDRTVDVLTDQILALIPDEEKIWKQGWGQAVIEYGRKLRDAVEEAKREEKRRICVWRLESCPHSFNGENAIKGGCGACWQILQGEDNDKMS